MNRHDSFLADRSVTVETRDAKPWDRREFVKGMAALAGSAGLLGYDLRPAAAEPPPETTRIRIIDSSSICVAPQYLAEELLRVEGFSEVTYVKRPAGATFFSVLVADQADFTLSTLPELIPGIDSRQPIVLLAGVHAGCYELFGNQRIRSVRDLNGKKVAVSAMWSAEHVYIASMAAYVGMNPLKDIDWVIAGTWAHSMSLFVEGKADAFLGFPPQPQELRARKIGHVVVNTTQDRPWSQYFCCMFAARSEFVKYNPIATKRALRAILKATDICAREPERAARFLAAKGLQPHYETDLEVLKGLPYDRWRQSDPEDSLRFHALRLYEVGMIKSSPQKLIAQGTDWRFLNELKRELKA